jgi:hypothetical protein
MKKKNSNVGNEIKYVSEAERNKMQNYINDYNKKLRRKNEVMSNIGHSAKYIFYTPIAIAANILSSIFKIGGGIAAVGMPYGIYCIYKTIVQLNAGIALEDIKQTTFVCLFVIFPFIAFALSLAFEKLSDYLTYNR